MSYIPTRTRATNARRKSSSDLRTWRMPGLCVFSDLDPPSMTTTYNRRAALDKLNERELMEQESMQRHDSRRMGPGRRPYLRDAIHGLGQSAARIVEWWQHAFTAFLAVPAPARLQRFSATGRRSAR